MSEAKDRPWIRWVMAGAASLLVLLLLSTAIGSLVPQIGGRGPRLGGVAADDLRTACRIAGPAEMQLCQSVFRIDAAVKDGRCTAANLHARPVLALSDGSSPLHDKLRQYAQAQVDRCAEMQAAP